MTLLVDKLITLNNKHQMCVCPKNKRIILLETEASRAKYQNLCKGKSLSEPLLFAEHGENMLCTKIVLNVRNNFCTQHVLSRFELGIFKELVEQ